MENRINNGCLLFFIVILLVGAFAYLGAAFIGYVDKGLELGAAVYVVIILGWVPALPAFFAGLFVSKESVFNKVYVAFVLLAFLMIAIGAVKIYVIGKSIPH